MEKVDVFFLFCLLSEFSGTLVVGVYSASVFGVFDGQQQTHVMKNCHGIATLAASWFFYFFQLVQSCRNRWYPQHVFLCGVVDGIRFCWRKIAQSWPWSIGYFLCSSKMPFPQLMNCPLYEARRLSIDTCPCSVPTLVFKRGVALISYVNTCYISGWRMLHLKRFEHLLDT